MTSGIGLGAVRCLVFTDPAGENHRFLATAPPTPICFAFVFDAFFANDGTLLYVAPEAETARAVAWKLAGRW